MDVSKAMLALCCLAVSVCLILSITALCGLRNTIAENEVIQQEAVILVDQLNSCLENIEEVEKDNASLPTIGNASDEKKENLFYIREVNDRIGVYTGDGYLIRLLERSVQTLPKADRDALSNGICVSSWQEVTRILQDYDA